MTEKGDSSTLDDTAYGAASAIVLATTGVPLPPTVLKNATRALGALVTRLFQVPAAALDAKAQAIKDKADARSSLSEAEAEARARVLKAASIAAAKRFGTDEDLAERAVAYFADRIVGEQRNREEIGRLAALELQANPPQQDAPEEIDEDWLGMFARHAETKSGKDMRAYFGRVLAGEIRKPGSFSPATIQALACLTPQLAELFQRFCNISGEVAGITPPFVLAQVYGEPGSNALAALGFNFTEIARLMDAGLVQPVFNTAKTFSPLLFSVHPFVIAGRPMLLVTDKSLEQVSQAPAAHLSSLNFSQAGRELRQIVHMTPNEEYVAKFLAWAKTQGMHPRVEAPPAP